MKHIAGMSEVLANLVKRQSKVVEKVAEATEKACVQVGIDAASDHTRGFAHAVGRYENQTTTLTRSLLQAPKAVKVEKDEVIFSVGSNVEYAMHVEAIYPYLWPAAVGNKRTFKEFLAEALK